MSRFAVSLRARVFAAAAIPLGCAVASCGVLSGILPDESRGAIADAPENEVKQSLIYDRATNRMVALPEAVAAADIMRGKAVVPVGQLEADGRITPVMMEPPKPAASPASVVIETAPVAPAAGEVQPAGSEGGASKQPMRIAPADQGSVKPAGKSPLKAAAGKPAAEPVVAKANLAAPALSSAPAGCLVTEAGTRQESGEALMAALARPGSMVLVFSNRTAAGEAVRDPEKAM